MPDKNIGTQVQKEDAKLVLGGTLDEAEAVDLSEDEPEKVRGTSTPKPEKP